MRDTTSAGMSRRQLLEAVGTAAVATVGLAVSGEAGIPPPQIAVAWITFWNSRDVNSAAALFADNTFYEDVPFGVINHSLKELQAFAQGYFSSAPSDARFDLINSEVNGGHGYIEWVWSTTDTFIWKTGKKFSVRGLTALDLAGNKIVRNLDFWDMATALRQVGLLPPGL
jgi:steroid delta-isomerase-like uncharacterized protein